MVPLSGKLGIQERIALKEYLKAREKLRKEKIDTLHMLRMNIYEMKYARNAVKILDEIRGHLKLLIESEVAANKAGTGSLSGVIKANIEYGMIEEEIINIRQEEKENEEKIYYILGDRVRLDLPVDPGPVFADFNKEEVMKKILSDNPDIVLARLDVDTTRDEVALKQNESSPDMEVGASYMQRDNNGSMKRTDMVSVMATLNLPVWFWKKNVPMVDEMKKKNEAAKNIYQDKLNELRARAETLVTRLVKWRDLYKLYHDRLIPQSELALETDLARYRTGTVEFMPVIDTVRMLLRYKKELAMTVKEYYASYSELSALMGAEVLP
jgi:outer membrane protein TolC